MIDEIMKSAGENIGLPAENTTNPIVQTAPTPATTPLVGVNQPEEKIPAWAKQLMEENAQMRGELKMFKDLAGKNEIASYMDKQKDFSKKTAHFKKLNGKIIVAWSDADYSDFKVAKDGLNENVFTNVTYLDGSKEKVNIVLLHRIKDEIKVPIIEWGAELAKVEWPAEVVEQCKLDSKTSNIEIKFLNR